MALSRLGDLIHIIDERNSSDCDFPFYGINIDKQFMPSVANTTNLDRTKYKVIRKYRFVYSGMQTGRDNCIRIGLFLDENPVLVSPAYTTFEVSSSRLLPEYLFMYFNSKEKDRYGAFLSDSSVRSNLDWERFCDIVLEIPSIEIQKKYVAIYEGLLANLHSYERGLDDLKLVCDGYIEKLRRKIGTQQIGPFIEETDERNSNLSVKLCMGVNNAKEFVLPKQVAKEGKNAKIVRHNQFAYNRATTRNGEKISIAYRTGDDCVVSSAYGTFKIIKHSLNPEYLMLWFKRSEFDRYARYMSKGSAHEFFEFQDMQEVEIPVPDISIQEDIVRLSLSVQKRKTFLEVLNKEFKKICPVLIRGSIEESKGGSL